MDLKSGYPWWAVRNGLIHAFPPLEKDLRCDVLVVGGGITGALIADELSHHGHDVALIEQRDIGWGSTAAARRCCSTKSIPICWNWPSATARTPPRLPTGRVPRPSRPWERSLAG